MRPLAPLLLALLVSAAPARSAAHQTWDRSVAPGIVFRMERRADPPLSVYGLRLNPRRVQPESALARKRVYDLGPLNGREVLSGMVREYDALGGVNGDFFQFGRDPGGDPQNLMVRGGELLSHPVGGSRGFAVGWGPEFSFTLGAAAWEASFSASGGAPRPIRSLNARVDTPELTLHTDSAGYVYATTEVTAVRVWVGAYRLAPEATLKGKVTAVFPLRERVRVAPGEILLTGGGNPGAALRALRPGDPVEVRVRVTGFDWSRVRDVMGGGPLLLREGRPALPPGPDSFRDTRHPRTALGRTADGHLWFVVVDGRQAMSAGATLAELAEILRGWGCSDAINLDGGGSSTLNLLGLTLNRPSAGTERPIANGILFYGQPLAAHGSPPVVRVAPEPVVAGKPAQIEVLRDGAAVPAEQCLYTAQGAGWCDQEGRLFPTTEGTIDIAVLTAGRVGRVQVKAVGAREAELAGFRVLPYLQEPSSTGMRLTWFTTGNQPGELVVTAHGRSRRYRSRPEFRPELAYSPLEESERFRFPDMFTPGTAFKHSLLLRDLVPDSEYAYTVTQGESTFRGRFRTAPSVATRRPIRIIAFADSETDPDGRLTKRDWKIGAQHPGSTGRPPEQTQYLVTETEGFRENLKIIGERHPDLVLLAGDLVQGGGYQRAWDEFFFHTAGKWDDLMSRAPLLAAFGNWESFGARNGGYAPQAVHASRRKFLAYFDGPPNGNREYRNAYHRVDYGPVTVLTLDSSNGLPDNTDGDTNKNIDATIYPGRDLPDIQPGSAQWKWCEAQLKDARRRGQIILVQFHHIPYSSGGHSLPLTAPGSSGQAGLPMRVYTPLFARYGVAAVLCGHNESFERSVAEGVLFYDAGVAGDGLGYSLSRVDPRFRNPFGRWVAHHDAPERWNGRQLLSGGKHYGHVEIEVEPVDDRRARLRFIPVHSFPVTDARGRITGFERREYADIVFMDYDRRTGKRVLKESVPTGP